IDLETVIPNGEGGTRYVHIRGEAVRDAQGTIVRVQGAFSDVTADVTERDRRRRVEDLLSTTLNQISDALCLIDRDWNFTFVNATFERLVGSSARELIGDSLWSRYPHVWSSPFGRAYRDCMHRGIVTAVHAYNDLFKLWLDVRVYPTEQGIAVYLKDVTADQVTLAALDASSQEIREKAELLDSARDAIFVRDLDNNIRYWNRAAAELYGWGASGAPDQSVSKMLYGDSHRFEEATTALFENGFWTGELQKSTPGGRIVIVDARWQLLLDDENKPYAILAVDTEITAAKQEETKLIQAQRLESLGTLAGGIAHDLNNVLTPMLLSVQLLDESETDSGRQVMLKSIETGIRRGADMIKQVLTFARGVEGEQQEIDVASLVSELETLAKYGLPKTVEISTQLEESLPPVVGDSTQIMQVLLNLLTNAKDAMPSGGTLSIRARNLELAPDYVSTVDGADPGRYVVLEVEDTGEGMSEEVASKIFEPFFTTKEVGQGTGLGLATSMSIVRSHGGFMSVYTELGTGTRFRVHLPVGEPKSTNQPAPPPQDVSRGTGERILVVDDEEWILATVRRILDDSGYETTVAANGREAIDTVESSEQRFDLVLTDMMMPVMDGAATIAYLAEHHPEIAVVAASGLSTNGDLARASHSGGLEFIDKPFTRVELLQAVRRALNERAQRTS
ncbi:MAG: response regulator, partial [Salinibacterium sp.]|nr:response regulator [Salinibacterium sp.]